MAENFRIFQNFESTAANAFEMHQCPVESGYGSGELENLFSTFNEFTTIILTNICKSNENNP